MRFSTFRQRVMKKIWLVKRIFLIIYLKQSGLTKAICWSKVLQFYYFLLRNFVDLVSLSIYVFLNEIRGKPKEFFRKHKFNPFHINLHHTIMKCLKAHKMYRYCLNHNPAHCKKMLITSRNPEKNNSSVINSLISIANWLNHLEKNAFARHFF